jgi:hypothetical protein
MRRLAWISLVALVFVIPWEYSLDLAAPFGNIARIFGLISALIAVPVVLQSGTVRKFTRIHWLTLALYAWLCFSFFWTVNSDRTLTHLRGYAQEMMLLWLVWEFVENSSDLRIVLWAWVAGSWVLAILTIAEFALAGKAGAEQFRFAAIGQDPNDVARYINFGFPVAAILLHDSGRAFQRFLLLGYFPVGVAAALLTASRSGILVASVAVSGCGVAILRGHRRYAAMALIAIVVSTVWVLTFAPAGTLERIKTLREVRRNPDLNQRVDIWRAGWKAFERAPMLGHGTGSFVTAAGLSRDDTAHNTALAMLVENGLCGLLLATAIVVVAARAIWRTRGTMRLGLTVLMAVWAISSLVGTVGESRMTWLMFGIIAVAEQVSTEERLGKVGEAGLATATTSRECLEWLR